MITRSLAVAVALSALAGTTNAAIVFDTTPGAQPAGYLPGIASDDGPNRFTLDDVAVVTGGATQLDITRVTFILRVNPNQPSATFNVVAANTDGNAADFNGLLLRPFISLGSFTIPTNFNTTAGNVNAAFSVGDGIATLGTVNLDPNFFTNPAIGAFAIGLQSSSTNLNTGRWTISTTPGGDPGFFWDYLPGSDVANGTSFGATTASTFSVRIEGNLVPTPAAAGLLGLGGLVAGRRRRA